MFNFYVCLCKYTHIHTLLHKYLSIFNMIHIMNMKILLILTRRTKNTGKSTETVAIIIYTYRSGGFQRLLGEVHLKKLTRITV